MNRLQVASLPSESKSTNLPQISQAQVQTCESVPHAVFAPMHYEPGYSYPLLVWLHGPADDERQLQRVMPLISMRNYVAIGPRGTAKMENSPGYCWRQTEQDIAIAEQHVLECIEQASLRFNIAPGRVFVGGFQSGATMAFRIGLRYPSQFAGIVSIGGSFPTGHAPLANLDQAREVPLFVAHGRDAEQYPIERTCDELRLFHSAGFAVTIRQYPCGDDLTTQMLHDLDVWMMELVTGTKISAT